MTKYIPFGVRALIDITTILLILVMGALTVNTGASATELKARVQYENDRYLLGPGDMLQVSVLDEPEYAQQNILVHPDGVAVFTGIGEIDVENRSITDVTQEITDRLKRTMVAPKVMLTLVSTRPSTLYLHGAVKQPGILQMATGAGSSASYHIDNNNPLVKADMKLSSVLSSAGGVQMNADLANIQITRESAHLDENGKIKKEVITANLWRMLKEGAKDQDILLQPGDVIYVPQAKAMAISDEDYDVLLRSPLGPKDFPVRIIGQVKTPGMYNLNGTSPFLNSALAQAGGFAPEANQKVIAVRRFSDDQQSFTTFFIEPKKGDIYLRPNDVLYISENKMYKSGRFFQQAANILSPFQSVAAIGSSTAQIFGLGGWNQVINGNNNNSGSNK